MNIHTLHTLFISEANYIIYIYSYKEFQKGVSALILSELVQGVDLTTWQVCSCSSTTPLTHFVLVVVFRANLAIVKELGDRGAQGRACGNLGNTHYLLGNFELAIMFHEEVFIAI